MFILDGWNWRSWAGCFRRYCIRVGDAISQLLNVAIFLGTNPNESVSGRSWRLKHQLFWGLMAKAIDFAASPFETDHCKKAHEADFQRALNAVKNR